VADQFEELFSLCGSEAERVAFIDWLWRAADHDRPAWSADPVSLPDDTRRALETDGRAELLKVLDQDEPPRVIRCGCSGCSYLSASEAGEWPS
jgi:hypothetical protein